MEYYVAPVEESIHCYFKTRTSKTLWVHKDHIVGYVYSNCGREIKLYTRQIDKVFGLMIKSGEIFGLGDHFAYTNPWPPSQYTNYEPVITMDLILYEVMKYLSFRTMTLVGSTCKFLDSQWRLFIKTFPPENMMNDHYINPCDEINNDQLSLFTNLTSLNMGRNSKLTDKSISGLHNLIKLDLGWNKEIEGYGLMNLARLEKLYMGWNEIVTDEWMGKLSQLTSLRLGFNEKLTSRGLSNLTRLKSLHLGHNRKMLNDGLITLTNLTKLTLGYNMCDLNASISLLVNLESLDLCYNEKITKETLSQLTNLKVCMAGKYQGI